MSKKTLIVVDMQNDFIDGSLGTKEAQAIVDHVVQKIRHFDGNIIYTLDTHQANYLNTMEGKKLPVVHCIEGTDGWKINHSVMEALESRNAIPLTKPTFGSCDLADMLARTLSDSEDTELELIGLCTDICVVSNALLLRAKFPNAVIRVDASCCAGVTPQSHDAALTTMQMCQIDIAR